MMPVFSRMPSRVLPLAVLALAGSLAALVPAPVEAARGAYIATLAAPLAADRQEIIDGALWKCSGDRCVAPVQGGRPVFVCAKVAGKFGPVASFATPAGALSDAEVSRCNALK